MTRGGLLSDTCANSADRPSGSFCLLKWEYSPHENRADFVEKIIPYFLLYRFRKGYKKHNTKDNYIPCVSLCLRNFYARVKIS